MNKDLISFNELNEKHMKAFKYFAYDAGHPEYVINGIIADSDFDFRELLAEKFNLNECFVEDPNGCNHTLISRTNDLASFEADYGTEYDQDGYDVVSFSFNGKLFYNTETEKVVLEPLNDSIVMTSKVNG